LLLIIQTVPLPNFVSTGAKIEQGLVTLTLPKAEHVKPRNITVS